MTALGEDSITLTIPPAVEALLGPPALLAGESAETYNAMLSDFAAAVGPSDFVEWVWVKDVTDLTWEIVRVRRFKTGIIANAQKDGLTSILDSLVQDGFLYSLNTEQPNQMATQWFAGGEARKEVAAKLEQFGLGAESIPAQAFLVRCRQLATIEQMLASAEKRRNTTLREISRRRDSLARQLRKKSDELISADGGDASRVPLQPNLSKLNS